LDYPHLEVNNLTFQRSGTKILDIEKLSINKGEFFVIIGPNGAGKSTLLRLLALLEKPSSGKLIINREVIDNSSNRLAVRRRMAMVFQDSLLFASSVFENVAYGLKARRYSKNQIGKRVRDVLVKLSISHLADRKASELSGGEAQRVSLARALVLNPEILLLDEPLASLDPPTREVFRTDLIRLVKEEKLTAVFVTQYRTEAQILADRVAVLIDGKILQVGTPEEIFNYPEKEEVARFVGCEILVPGIIEVNNEGLAIVKVKDNEIEAVTPVREGEEVIVCIRPEEITLGIDSKSEERTSARNKFLSKITQIRHNGILTKVDLDCGFPLVAVVTKKSAEELGLVKDKEVTASFKATAVHVIRRG